jgi:Tfp pilus assembly pilus retraction ATPase PilT|tara:strand:- start:746 stop:1132 length:387 start_codon:yes stop_codon:yes gene_type:complete
MQTFTQHEKDFVVEFLADVLHGLTINNVISRQDGNGFVRIADALEVMQNLQTLYNAYEDEEDFVLNKTNATWTFNMEDAQTALRSYDTEYRDCIVEQFEDACTDALADAQKKLLDANYATLADRINNY